MDLEGLVVFLQLQCLHRQKEYILDCLEKWGLFEESVMVRLELLPCIKDTILQRSRKS